MSGDINTRALVLREVSVGESDKLLTVLAEDMGRLTLTCKGVRNVKSHRLSATQLFCYNHITISQRGGKYYLKEASLIENFYSIRENIESLALSQYVCQLAEDVATEGQSENELLSLTLNTLYLISKQSYPIYHIKSTFEFRLCLVIGMTPDLSACTECGKNGNEGFLDIEEGRLICPECAAESESKNLFSLTPAVLEALRYIQSVPPKRVFAFSLAEHCYPELCEFSEEYLIYRIEKKPETLKFYHSLGL